MSDENMLFIMLDFVSACSFNFNFFPVPLFHAGKVFFIVIMLEFI